MLPLSLQAMLRLAPPITTSSPVGLVTGWVEIEGIVPATWKLFEATEIEVELALLASFTFKTTLFPTMSEVMTKLAQEVSTGSGGGAVWQTGTRGAPPPRLARTTPHAGG